MSEEFKDGCGCQDDCGCNEVDYDHITLTLDDDSEIVCINLGTFEVGNNVYIALLPEDADEDSEVFVYRYNEGEGDDFSLENIEDDEEFEAVSEAFDEFMDQLEFDEIFEEDEEEEEEKEEEK